MLLLTCNSWFVPLDMSHIYVSLLTCYSWLVSLHVTLVMSLLICPSWLVNLDLLLLTFHSRPVTEPYRTILTYANHFYGNIRGAFNKCHKKWKKYVWEKPKHLLIPATFLTFFTFFYILLKGGAVPPFKMHAGGTAHCLKCNHGGTVRSFKMYPGRIVPAFKMHPAGTLIQAQNICHENLVSLQGAF